MGSSLKASRAPSCRQHGLRVHVQQSSGWHLFARKSVPTSPVPRAELVGFGGVGGGGGE